MNKTFRFVLLAILVLAAPVLADNQSAGIGARYHAENSKFADMPYGNGDLSYSVLYEVHEEEAALQFIADYAPSLTGSNNVDYAVTPAVNLILEDHYLRGGLGIMTSYLKSDNPGWTKVYWQFLLGLEVPIMKKFSAEAMAYYPFESWSKLNDFNWKFVEYGLSLKYNF